MKGKATNIVINEIMSSQNSSTIILTESDGEHVGFLADLANNYRTTFWINASFDKDYSLPFAIAHRVIPGDSSLMNKLTQFLYCKLDFTKDLIVINAVLDYISELGYNCLMIIDNVDTVYRDYNYKSIELLLKNCPSNLKIVLISNKFIDLNYNVFTERPPKLICREQLDVSEFDEAITDETFTVEQWRFLYQASKKRFIEKQFASEYVDGGAELLTALATKYRTSVMQTGQTLFNVNPKLGESIQRKGLVSTEESNDEEFDRALYSYYLSGGIRNYVKALKIAIEAKDVKLVDDAVKIIIKNRIEVAHLYEFVQYSDEFSLGEIPQEYVYARYFMLLEEIVGEKKASSGAAKARKLYEELSEQHPLNSQAASCIIRAEYLAGRKLEGAEFARAYIADRLEKYGEEYLPYVTAEVDKLADGLQSLNMAIIVQRYRIIEKYLSKEEFKNEFWYCNMLQTFVGCNLELGNYKLAVEYLNKIKQIIPFYVVPSNMVSAYFFSGDMTLAAKNAEDIILKSKWDTLGQSVTDAYLTLALVHYYYNEMDKAVGCVDDAVNSQAYDEYTMITAIALRAMIYSAAGKADYAKDLALLYVKRCEITGSKYTPLMHGAAAFCYWTIRKTEEAIAHARKCIIGSAARSVFWFTSTAIIIDYMFDGDDYKACRGLVEKFFNASKNFGMDMLTVTIPKLFDPLIEYAVENGIETEYVAALLEKSKGRKEVENNVGNVKIKLMGSTIVSVGGEELIWKTKKAKELFLLYVLKGEQGVDRNEIIEMFWGDYVYVSAINNLKTTNNIIRNTLAAKNVPFKLEYSNSKYSLHIDIGETDYDCFLKEYRIAAEEKDCRKRAMKVARLTSFYGEGFATDIKVKFFNERREARKEEFAFLLMKLIKELCDAGDFLEAKRYLAVLKKVQPESENGIFTQEIERRLFNI